MTRERLAPYLHLAALLACQGVANAGAAAERAGGDVRRLGEYLFALVEQRIER